MMTVREYLRQMNASPEERKEALAWVLEGNDFMTNRDGLADEFGYPMYYISASRAMEEICAQFVAMIPEELAEELSWQNPRPDDLVKDCSLLHADPRHGLTPSPQNGLGSSLCRAEETREEVQLFVRTLKWRFSPGANIAVPRSPFRHIITFFSCYKKSYTIKGTERGTGYC